MSLLLHYARLHAAFDDDALAALANRGLVKRAAADLARAVPVPCEEAGVLRFVADEATVTAGEQPSGWRCSCNPPGVCRHVLRCVLFLRQHAPASAAEVAPALDLRATLLAIADDDLRRWAGAGLVEAGTEQIARGLVCELPEGTPPLAQFPSQQVTIRCVPPGGLIGILCSQHKAEPCVHKIAAVLAWQIAAGQRVQPQATIADTARGAPRSRDDVRAGVERVLQTMLAVGLTRLAQRTEHQLRDLALAAHGIEFPRLEKELNRLAESCEQLRSRQAQATSGGLLALAARVAALVEALAIPTPVLAGEHRSTYENVGDRELLGLAARGWETASGFQGLTVYFWDRRGGGWNTWTDSRPIANGGLDPRKRFKEFGPWDGCDTPAEASARRVRLRGAFRNPAGRLSARAGVDAELCERSPIEEVPAVRAWSDLHEPARQLFGGSLNDQHENRDLAILRPVGWEAAIYDAHRQECSRGVVDAAGRMLPLWLPFSRLNEEAIDRLERYEPTTQTLIVAHLRQVRGRLMCEPISLWETETTVHLTLAASSRRRGSTRPAAAIATGPSAPPDALSRFIDDIGRQLEGFAEAGIGGVPVGRVEQLHQRVAAAGLTTLAESLQRLVSARLNLADGEPALAASTALLRAAHITGLTRAQIGLANRAAVVPS